MINKTLLLFLAAALVPTLAVVNGNGNNKKEAQRREASLSDAYGPPQALQLPAPIYGQPAFATYPAPPPDVPPPAPVPHKEYGVPVSKYGPPTTVNIEYGPPQAKPFPPQKPSFLGQSLPSFNQVSFFDQIKSMFTGGGSGAKHQNYGPPPPPPPRKSYPKPNYGPPQQHRPAGNYGPPPSPQSNYGPPAQNYGPPQVQHIVHRPPPPQQQVIHHHVGKPVQNYGPPPPQNHGPPAHHKPLGPQFASSGSGTPFRVNCDGWKPIPGPAIPYDSSGPSSSYGPPASGNAGLSSSSGSISIGHSASSGGSSFGHSASGGGSSFGHSASGGGSSFGHSASGGGSSFGHSASGGGASFDHSANGGGASFGHSGSGGGGSFGHSASAGGDSASFAQSSGTSYSQSGGSAYAEQQNVDQDIGSLLTVPINEAQAFHGGSDASQGHGQEFTNSIVGGDSYSAPPIETYAPGTYAPSFLLKQEHSSNHGASQVSTGHGSGHSFDHHSIGLIPPGPRYGAPGGGAHIDAGLAIKHGSVSGNLKPWPVKGAPPRQPLSFREPVPQGLIESIGQSVTHLDNFGVKPQQHGGVYLPPPAAELPVPSNDLNVLPVNQAPQQFLTQHNFQQSGHGAFEQQGFLEQSQQLTPPKYAAPKFHVQQFQQQSVGQQFSSHHHQQQQQQQFNSYPSALPLVQEPRYAGYSGMSDCGRGPQSFGGHQQGQFQQQTFVSDSYGLPAQGPAQGFDSYGPPPQQQAQYQQQTLHSNVVTSYQVAPSNVNAGSDLETPQSSYGPPASGNPTDNQGYESQVKSATTTIEGESKDTQESASSQSLNLPGLSSVGGLDLLSAQKSQSLEIPVQGALGSYQLQFQAADPIGSAGNDIENPPHQQILSEGLLQSILSAIEQPNQGNAIPQITYDQQTDHSDAAVFLESPEGQKVLSEPAKARR